MGQRVDALIIAFALEVFPSIRDELLERQSIADLAGTAQINIGELTFAMRRSRRRDSMLFENADLRGTFDERAVGGWQLELVVRAVHLATHSLEDVIALARRTAEGFGAIKSARLRRFDLAVDVVGFPLRKDDTNRIVTRARIDAFIAHTKDTDEVSGGLCKPAVREHHSANHTITGFSIAQGNPLMARIYDKTIELAQPGREEKRAIELEIWSRNGWNGTDPVTRVEFQHRGQFLDDVALRGIETLVARLDEIWQLDVRWLRLVDPSSATRLCRCCLDPRWATLTEVVFTHVAQPATRKRQRGGATSEQVLGATLSRLASSGRLSPIDLGTDGDGVLLNESTFAHLMTPDEAVAWLQARLVATFGSAARDAARALRGLEDPRDAVARYIAKHNSSVARFSSSDDARSQASKSAKRNP